MSRPELSRFAPFAHGTHVYSVSELALHIGSVLDADAVLSDVWLRGEVVNLSRSPAGHTYFVLKDEQAQLRCVLFRGSAFNSPVKPVNGLALVAHGSLRFYERHGTCELVADLLFPEGVGLAQMQWESVYRRLEAEGLFDASRKRPLPAWPRVIGVVSSERGAVIHDLLSVLRRRFPLGEVVFVPTPVQGPAAPVAMAHAVSRLGHWQRDERGVDLIVVARGGGSDEDLSAFNDERVARALFASPVPVVSAVGHETNQTLADLVADVRAATPSAAAELIVPDIQALRRDLAATRIRLGRATLSHVAHARSDVRAAGERLTRQFSLHLDLARARVEALAARLQTLSPAATLSRGYAIVRAGDRVVRDARTVEPGATLHVQLHHGRLTSTVDAVEPEA